MEATPQQLKEHAYSISIAITAMIEAIAMHTENQQRAAIGAAPAYTESNFIDLTSETHHNAFLTRWAQTE